MINIKELLFWVFLILAIVLLFWNVFGDSPSEFIALVAIIFMVVMEVGFISDKQIITEFKVDAIDKSIKESFNNIKRNMNLIKRDLSLIKNKIN